MGTEAVWVPLLAAAVSGGASYVNTRNTANKQDAVLAEGIREKSRRQVAADAKVNELIQKTGESNPDADKARSLDQYRLALKNARPLAGQSIGNVSGASAAYQNDANAAATGANGYADNIASIMSRLDGPLAQRRREGNDQGNFGVAIDQIKRFAEGDDFLNKLKLNGVRRNPLLDAFSSLASGYAGSAASGGGSGLSSIFGGGNVVGASGASALGGF